MTFDWENATVNGTVIEQTVSGITATFTVGTNNPQLKDTGGFAGTSGFIVASTSNENTTATFTFSSPINITSIHAAEGISSNETDETWTFVPIGGTNSSVDVIIPNGVVQTGVTVPLNWDNISQFTVTSSGNTVFFAFDNIIIDNTLSNQEFNKVNTVIELFPNPSNSFFKISGLEKKENYTIYSVLGTEIKRGTVSENEKIDIQNFTNGLYFLKFDHGNTIKFKKE